MSVEAFNSRRSMSLGIHLMMTRRFPVDQVNRAIYLASRKIVVPDHLSRRVPTHLSTEAHSGMLAE